MSAVHRIRVDSIAPSKLVVVFDDYGFRWLLLPAVLFVFYAFVSCFQHPFNRDHFWGGLAGAVVFFLSALLMSEKSEFVLDAERRVISWHRTRLTRRSGGEIRFERIKQILLDRPIGDEGVPSYRLLFVTEDGNYPVSWGYIPDTGWAMAIYGQVRDFLAVSDPEKWA